MYVKIKGYTLSAMDYILDKVFRDRVLAHQRRRVSLASEHDNCCIIAGLCEKNSKFAPSIHIRDKMY